jgi:hypothetical protein
MKLVVKGLKQQPLAFLIGSGETQCRIYRKFFEYLCEIFFSSISLYYRTYFCLKNVSVFRRFVKYLVYVHGDVRGGGAKYQSSYHTHEKSMDLNAECLVLFPHLIRFRTFLFSCIIIHLRLVL